MEQKIEWKVALQKYLPAKIYEALNAVKEDIAQNVEEIRLRACRPLMIYTCDKGYCVKESGALTETDGITVSEDDTEQTLQAVTGRSPYAYKEEISMG